MNRDRTNLFDRDAFLRVSNIIFCNKADAVESVRTGMVE